VEGLRALGFGVSIEHLNEAEAEHKVSICLGEEEMCGHPLLQHNRHYHERKALSEALVQQLVQKLADHKAAS